MIRFACSDCNRSISVDDKYAGRKGKCPKCGSAVVVPERSTIIAFHCGNCGRKIKVPDSCAGKKGKCPDCKNQIVVPRSETESTENTGTLRVVCPMCDQTIETQDTSGERLVVCPGCGSYVDSSPQDTLSASPELSTSISAVTHEGSYQEEAEVSEEPEGPDLRLILTLSGAAVVVVVVLIVVATFLRRSKPEPAARPPVVAQIPLDQANEIVEQCLEALGNGEVDRARGFLSPTLTDQTDASQIEGFSRRIAQEEIIRVDYQRARREEHSDEDRATLWYNIRYRQGGCTVVASVTPAQGQWRIDGIAARDRMGRTASLGPRSFFVLDRAARVSASRTGRPLFPTFFCGLLIALLVLAIVQIAAWWIVYERAGYAGWASIVPFYNMWVLAEIADKPGWLGLLMCFSGFIPAVGLIIGLVLQVIISVGVARAFDRGVPFGLGLSFLPVVFYPILAFTKD